MKYIILTLATLLTGCVTIIEDNQNFTYIEGTNSVVVRWSRVSDEKLQTVCAPKDKKFMFDKVFLGCAAVIPTNNNVPLCIIYTSTNTNHQILGHELRHCFQGRFHD